jgi:hypothetical protein
MIDEPGDFRSRITVLLDREGIAFTDLEVARITDRYPRCRGKDAWGVREYARHAVPGAREYRVLRGAGVDDVYSSVEPERAAAVRAALNEMEWEDRAPKDAIPHPA